ncbi:MAG TPA: hypothetical protein PLD59_15075 [Tepidisphaeraceae bacterium]|nr:hypothetical protein [Tepidisphaeraceae bacterium]
MRSVVTITFCAAITLWLGGLVALFLFVQVMFHTDRAVALNAAPMLFDAFEKYQLVLLAVAILSLIAWRLMACSTAKRWITTMLLLAGVLAVVQSAVVSSRMQTILASGQSGGQEFRRLHGYSMMVYLSEAGLLAAAACLLPTAIRSEADSPRQTLPQTATA